MCYLDVKQMSNVLIAKKLRKNTCSLEKEVAATRYEKKWNTIFVFFINVGVWTNLRTP